jgi:hypothetical protein
VLKITIKIVTNGEYLIIFIQFSLILFNFNYFQLAFVVKLFYLDVLNMNAMPLKLMTHQSKKT